MPWKATARSARSLRGYARFSESIRKKFRSEQFCDRDSPNPSVLILSHVATCLTAGLAIVSAVLAKAHIVGSQAMRAVAVTLTVSFVPVTLNADKFVRHRFSL